jgi:ribosome-associated protein
MEEIRIRGEMIRLGQLLKLAGVIDSGAEVKGLLAADEITVNGDPEARRGRQLHPGDVVGAGRRQLVILATEGVQNSEDSAGRLEPGLA